MKPKYAFFEGEIVPYEKAKIGVMTHAFHYGTGAFGGIRGYWNDLENQLYVFRVEDHYKRLLNSGKILLMEFDYTPAQLAEITLELLRKEEHKEDVYIRPLLYKSDELIGVRLHDLSSEITIMSFPFTKYVKNDDNAHVTFSSWRRVDDNMMPARGKITGAYVNTAFIKTDAVLSGYDEALVLNVDGHLSEGSAENLFMIRDGKLITPPVTDNILEGITRRTIMELAAKELGMEIVERSIDRTEIYISEEMFMTGTAAQVTAITRVDHRSIGNGKMGPVAARLRELYDSAVRGKLDNYRHWNTPVY